MGAIAVLGLGPSLSLFNPLEFQLSIGVNDIWSRVKTDIVICLDAKSSYKPQRLKVIEDCRPQKFYSQIVNWDTHPGFELIKLATYYPNQYCNLDISGINKSYCSPFVACGIAYKYYSADEIHLFGVDLIGHSHFDSKQLQDMKQHFKMLKAALKNKRVELVVHGDGYLKGL
jgi:hypothetical protein